MTAAEITRTENRLDELNGQLNEIAGQMRPITDELGDIQQRINAAGPEIETGELLDLLRQQEPLQREYQRLRAKHDALWDESTRLYNLLREGIRLCEKL